MQIYLRNFVLFLLLLIRRPKVLIYPVTWNHVTNPVVFNVGLIYFVELTDYFFYLSLFLNLNRLNSGDSNIFFNLQNGKCHMALPQSTSLSKIYNMWLLKFFPFLFLNVRKPWPFENTEFFTTIIVFLPRKKCCHQCQAKKSFFLFVFLIFNWSWNSIKSRNKICCSFSCYITYPVTLAWKKRNKFKIRYSIYCIWILLKDSTRLGDTA